MVYGYVRISTSKQSIERQIRNVRKYCGNCEIVEEVFTGTKTEGRKKWCKLLKTVKEGDTIIFDSVSRMSRNSDEGFETYQSLFEKGIELVFLKEPHINTATYKRALEVNISMTGTNVDILLEAVKKYLMALAQEQIQIAFDQAEKEVADLHQRTSEGIETARQKGKQIGQKKGVKLTTKKSISAKVKILTYSKDFGGVLNDSDCMKMLSLSRNTYYKYKRELKSEASA